MTKSDREYKVGDIVRFTLGYGGMLKTATSPYVEKNLYKIKAGYKIKDSIKKAHPKCAF